MKNNLLCFCFFITFHSLTGQQKAAFISPLDIPLILSGNFGELRSSHFHSGLDFKTQGVTGHQVYAVESGFVSRINIQPGGYGKALYIEHPNGYTTVYGHLSVFNERIEKYIKEIQYRRRSHTVNVYLNPGELTVDQGEIVALSGNTGSSTGPHLHFEIRRTAGQIPLNGLFFNLPIRDNIPPAITKLAIYPIGDQSHVMNSGAAYITTPENSGDVYTLGSKTPVRLSGKIGFGIEVYDYLNGAGNRCGVYSIELKINGKRHFYSEMNEFSFAESRFINAHIDYAYRYEYKSSIQRLYKLPYNELSIYKQLENNGYFEFNDTLVYDVEIEVADSYGNTAVLQFPVRGTGVQPLIKKRESFGGKILPYNGPASFADRNVKLDFPAYCFYEDVPFSYRRTDGSGEFLTDVFHIHQESTPVHKHFGIEITLPEIPEKVKDYLCLVKIEDDGKLTYAGGKFNQGKLSEDIRSFGRYAVSVDTVGPFIRPLNVQHGSDLTGLPGIRFQVKDELSGISSYNGFVDGEWVLFEYDPKNDLLVHEFDNRVPILKKIANLSFTLRMQQGTNRSIQ
jgi:murein DD-endopeptidase MepM/ murein hydrolase activator NlpD